MRKHDDHAIFEHPCFLHIKIRKCDTKKSDLLTHKMKWLIDLHTVTAFSMRQLQNLHRVTSMLHTQEDNLFPLLTAEQGYFWNKIRKIFAPFFNNPFQNGAYIYRRRSDNFSRRYMLFIHFFKDESVQRKIFLSPVSSTFCRFSVHKAIEAICET